MPKVLGKNRKQAVSDLKKSLILDAAKRVFERGGLENASLRAIAREADYTPAALYFHFDSKEAVYAALLARSLDVLKQNVEHAAAQTSDPSEQFRAAAAAYFQFFLKNPKDLDLGFYLSSGGMSPEGVGRERNKELNTKLLDAIRPVEAAALALSKSAQDAQKALTEFFVYANGILLLVHTGRIKLFEDSEQDLLENFVSSQIESLMPSCHNK